MKEKILSYQVTVWNFSVTPRMILNHSFFSGSVIMILGSNLTNFIAYLYHLVIGRILGPASYGELAAIISLMGLFLTTFNFLSLVVVKFVSAAKKSELAGLYKWFKSITIKVGVAVSLLLVFLTPFLGGFLHTNSKTILLLAPIMLLSSLGIVYKGFLQGRLKFAQVVIPTFLDVLGRFILGVILIYLGWSVFGAVFAIVISTLASLLLLKYSLNRFDLSRVIKEFKDGRRILKYSVAIFFGSIATNSIFSTDLVLVKHFFTAHDAGIYASISTLGRVIFYGTAPIMGVMFPIISRRHSRGKSFKKVFILSLLLVSVISLAVVILFYVFPEISIKILFGSRYLEASQYLAKFGVFMCIFAVASVILNFYLSLENSKPVIITVVTALFQAIGIWFYHNSISAVINISILAVTFMFISLFAYFAYDIKKGSD